MTRSQINAFRSSAPALAVLLSCLGLAACGGSSAGTAKTNTLPAAGAGAGSATATPGGALRECLQKQGITLPEHAAASGQLPKGVTRAQFEAAVKKCGGGVAGHRELLNRGAAQLQALKSFAACMRSNGVNLPAPNTSGNGPIFKLGGLNTASPQFRAARDKCVKLLNGVFGFGRPGAGP
jgi:hypothetical protein